MCGFLGSAWGFGLGGALELLGVGLLVRGLANTRRSFDPEWPGVSGWIGTRLATATGRARAALMRIFNSRQGVKGQVFAVETADEMEAAGEVRVRKTPPWDSLDPMQALQSLHAILYEERDRLLDRIREVDKSQEQGIKREAELRTEGDDSVRVEVLQLALGGLTQEAWAAITIMLGIVVTTLAGVCSVT